MALEILVRSMGTDRVGSASGGGDISEVPEVFREAID